MNVRNLFFPFSFLFSHQSKFYDPFSSIGVLRKRSVVGVTAHYPGTGIFTIDGKDIHYFSDIQAKEMVTYKHRVYITDYSTLLFSFEENIFVALHHIDSLALWEITSFTLRLRIRERMTKRSHY